MYCVKLPRKKGVKYTPLVFLHGALGSHRHWMYQANYFCSTHTCYVPDLPGHGRSGGVIPATIEKFAAVVEDWLHSMNLPPVVLLGHSMGGAISLQVALNRPDLVKRLVLVGTGAYLPVSPKFLNTLREGKMDLHFIRHVFAKTTDAELVRQAEKELDCQSPSLAYRDFNACNNFDIRDKLHEIKQETLVVCGQDDRLTPVKLNRELAHALPHARLEIIEDAGHMVMLEKPEKLNGIIEKFLE